MSRDAAPPGLPDSPESPYLTARQAAAYLQINEKKLYELASNREVPAAKVGGKWLFPRALIDAWLLEQAHGGALADRLLIGGSDDPWLTAAVLELAAQQGSDALVGYTPNGTLGGLEHLANRRLDACVLHWGPAARSEVQHPQLVARYGGRADWTLLRLARREQGVILRPGAGVGDLATLVGFDYRWAMRQGGAGSQHFLQVLMQDAKLRLEDCTVVATAYSERQAAAFVAQGLADCAPGTRGAAAEFGLDFLALGEEALDLALPKAVFFRTLFQQLLAVLGSPPLRNTAARLGGYDLSPLGSLLPLS